MSKNIDEIFSDSNNLESNDGIKPFFTVAKKNQEKIHKWLLHASSTMMKRNREKISKINDNYKMYTGRVFTGSNNSSVEFDENVDMETRMKDEKLYVNYIKTLVEEQVNRLQELKPNVEVVPVHNEFEDKMGAKAGKIILDTIWYDRKIDMVMQEFTRRTKIAGEHYLAVLWNPNFGELHPSYLEAKMSNKKTPALDDEGVVIPGKFVDTEVRVGDVIYKQVDARKLLAEPVERWENVDWVIEIDKEYTDVLREEYPHMKDKLGDTFDPSAADFSGFSQDSIARLNDECKTVVFRLYHRSTKYVPGGREIVFTLDGILEDRKLRYKHGKLPFIRRTDIDVDGEFNAMSFIDMIKGMQIQHYALTSGILANQKQFAYPRWFVQAKSVDPKQLGNTRGTIVYKGQKPEVYRPEPTSQEIYAFRSSLPQEMRLVGTGTAHDPAKFPEFEMSGVALQFLDEQSLKRFNTDVTKQYGALEDIAKMTLETTAQYYKKEDGRLGRVIGKNNEHIIAKFKDVSYDKPFDIRVKPSTGLPDSKAARIATIMELGAQFETLFEREQILDALELGDSNKMFDQATVAVKTAESIVEDLTQGNPVKPPEDYMNLIVLWKVLITRMQQRDFSEQLPEDIKAVYLKYVTAVELLMIEKAQINPAFQAEMLKLSLFPAVFKMNPAPPMDPNGFSGAEGTPGSAPITDPGSIDDSGQADPAAEILIDERSDAGSGGPSDF